MRKWILAFAVLTLPLFGQSPSVRELYALGDYEAAMRAFAALPAPSLEERAFGAAAYAFTLRTSAAKQQLELLQAAAPETAWTYFVQTAVLNAGVDIVATAAASEKMMALAGPNPDEEIVRQHAYGLYGVERRDEALALLAKAPQTRRIRAARASMLHMGPEEEKEAAAIYEALRTEAPEWVEAWHAPGRSLLGRRRYAEAIPLLTQAAALSPSPRVHADYWRALSSATDLTAEQKKEELERDIAGLRARRGDTPEVWLAIATDYARNGDDVAAAPWNDRILAEAPNTLYAARALWNRYTVFSKKHGAKLKEDAALRAEQRKIVREYLDYKTGEADYYRINAYGALYSIVKADPKATEAEIVEAVEGIRPTFAWNAGLASDAGMFLANRGVRLDLAEEIARSGFDHLRTTLMPSEYGGEMESEIRAALHTGLGLVLLERYGPDAARNHLFAAYELAPHRPTIQYHLGRWYEARKELAKAEQRYRYGATLQSSGDNPNEAALRKLYEKRHGTVAGYEAYRKSSEKADVVSRRSRILSERKKNAPSAPPFQLKTLDGKDVSLASLKGKTAVVNFWGIWCGWCVKEMPEYQQLAKKYANDPSVAILTINNDGDPASVRKWMATQKYDFHVLLDDGFVNNTKVTSFPTTWFVDPRGRIAFEKKGWTRALLEEFSWRVEELKAGR